MSEIRLKSSHIYLSGEIVKRVFGDISHAYATYVEKQGKLLITPVSSAWFIKVYEPTQYMLKARNLKGDKTLAIHEIIIDHQLKDEDQDLKYEIIDNTKLIKIELK